MLLFLALACHEAPEAPPQHTEPSPEITTSSTTTGVEGARVARLSHVQWHLTTTDLLYLDGADDLTTDFVESATPSWFENDRTALMVDPTLWMQYQAASEELAGTVANDPELLRRVAPIPDRDTFIEGFGLRAFRRPLTNAEKAAFASVFDEGSSIFGTGDPFADGVHAAIAAFLQSPWFIYRGLGFAGPGDGTELESYELASKLSYALWNTMPDEELMGLAADDELVDPEVLAAQAVRLLDHPRAVGAVDDFHEQLLHTDTYENIYKDPQRFPLYDAAMNEWMATEAQLYTREIVLRRHGIHTLYTAPWTMINDGLAPLYGVDGPGAEFARVDLDPSERAGLLTLTGFLAKNADAFEPGSIHRGVFIDLELLCIDMPAPPDNVPPLPPVDGDTTNRERVEAHTGDGTCGQGCHSNLINPVGFAFEGYDALGVRRSTDNGHPVDESGSFFFQEGETAWTDAIDFASVMADSDQAHRCYVQRWLEYLQGRAFDEADVGLVAFLGERSRVEDRPIRDLIVDVVTSDGFRHRKDEGVP
jgi:hypothetical protein